MADITRRVPDCGDGERGKRGRRGHRGHDGHDGHDGATGPTGPTGATGATGPSTSSRIAEISPLSGTSDTLPAGINSAGPQLNAGQIWWVPITANVGEQLNALTFRVFGNGSTDVAWGLFLFDYSTNTNTLVASGTVVDPPLAWTLTTPVFAAVPVNAGQVLVFFFQPNGPGSFAGLIAASIGPQP